jgi:hypothetical protein
MEHTPEELFEHIHAYNRAFGLPLSLKSFIKSVKDYYKTRGYITNKQYQALINISNACDKATVKHLNKFYKDKPYE